MFRTAPRRLSKTLKGSLNFATQPSRSARKRTIKKKAPEKPVSLLSRSALSAAVIEEAGLPSPDHVTTAIIHNDMSSTQFEIPALSRPVRGLRQRHFFR